MTSVMSDADSLTQQKLLALMTSLIVALKLACIKHVMKDMDMEKSGRGLKDRVL